MLITSGAAVLGLLVVPVHHHHSAVATRGGRSAILLSNPDDVEPRKRSVPGLGGRVPARPAADEYTDALAEAARASARLREAERRLSLERAAPQRRRRPRSMSSSIERSDAGTLLLSVPAAGLRNGGALMGGAFSLAWFSVVVPATLSGGGLFMLPFWLAGGAVAKQTVLEPATSTELSIGEFAWEIRKAAAGVTLTAAGGATDELRGAEVEVAATVNGVPVLELRLRGAAPGESWGVGAGLGEEELEYLADEVNEHLAGLDEKQEGGPAPLG